MMGRRDSELALRRRQMVHEQLRKRGITDERVLTAMEEVPRHLFIEPHLVDGAYDDHPLPIGSGQTISQPYMVARMTELCAPAATDRALEIGAGCGYQTAILARLCRHVYAIEVVAELAELCRCNLESVGATNVTVAQMDGSAGWPEHAPFDVILVAAAAPAPPPPLREQLADGGRLLVPVGGREIQVLERISRRGESFLHLEDTPCRFVMLRGQFGWDGERGA